MSEKLYQDKDWLYEQYWEQGKSLGQMASIARCTASTIYRSMRKYNVPRRTSAEGLCQKHGHVSQPCYQNAIWLHEMYYVKGKTIKEIAEIAQCVSATISYWMGKYNIPRRSSKQSRDRKYVQAPYRNMAWLYKLYWEQGKSTPEIARIAKCDTSVIFRWLRKYNIPLRTRAETLHDTNRRLRLKKRHQGEMTDAEEKCYGAFESLGLEFIFEKSVHPYWPDFFFPSHGVIVEAMSYWHTLPGKAEYDAERKQYLEACGYVVLEWWRKDILADIYKLIDEQLLPLLGQPSRMERPPRGVSKPYKGPHGWKSAMQLYLFGKEQED